MNKLKVSYTVGENEYTGSLVDFIGYTLPEDKDATPMGIIVTPQNRFILIPLDRIKYVPTLEKDADEPKNRNKP